MKIICDECGSDKVFIDMPSDQAPPKNKTMNDLKREATQGVPLVYHLTIYRCSDCGYTISY